VQITFEKIPINGKEIRAKSSETGQKNASTLHFRQDKGLLYLCFINYPPTDETNDESLLLLNN
jgi:hypothetical protein